MSTPRYSIVIPTYRRGDQLAECLESVCALDYPKDAIEVVIIDNGGAREHARVALRRSRIACTIRYLVNVQQSRLRLLGQPRHRRKHGRRILLLNDDARPMPDLLTECDRAARERSARSAASAAGRSSRATSTGARRSARFADDGDIVGNFDVDCGEPVEVEHVYGFCYVFTREAVRRAGLNDRTLLAQPYSSGNRIETDHCLSIRRAGLKVVYNPRMVARAPGQAAAGHERGLAALAPERDPQHALSLPEALRRCSASARRRLRLTFVKHVGISRRMRQPSRANLGYFVMALRARASAYGHYVKYLLGPRIDSPDVSQAAGR